MTSPALAVEMPDGTRCYRNPRTGETAPSVTTIIAAGIPKIALCGWHDRLSAEYADANWAELTPLASWERIERIRAAPDAERQRAADLGTAVHSAIDDWATGKPHNHPKEVGSYLNSYISFLSEKRPRFIENETTVWSRTYGYAGTLDWIAEIEGKTYLADTKSGRKVYPEVGLQLAALAHADFIIRDDGTEEPIPEFGFLAALHVRPRSWRFIPVGHHELNFKAFLACREIYSWTHDVAPHVLEAA